MPVTGWCFFERAAWKGVCCRPCRIVRVVELYVFAELRTGIALAGRFFFAVFWEECL